MSVVPALILSGTDYPDSVYHAHFAVKPSYFAEKIYRIGAFRPFSLIFSPKNEHKYPPTTRIIRISCSTNDSLRFFSRKKKRNSAKRSCTDRLTRKKANEIGKTVRHGLFRFIDF